MIGSFTYLDAALFAVAFISGLLAMYRGLTRELLSILSWIVAALAVLYFILNHREFAQEIAGQLKTQVTIVQIAMGAILFLVVLIVVHLITARISDTILDSQVGMVDRILGFLFGVARGFILVVIPYMFYVSFFPDEEDHYEFVRRSQSLPAIKSTGKAIQSTLLSVMPSNLMESAPEDPDQRPG